MGESPKFGIKSVPQTARAWIKRSKARVPFTSWCCYIVIEYRSRVIMAGINRSLWVGACNSTIFQLGRLHRPIYFENLLGIRLPRECHDQSQDSNWRHHFTGPELRFFHKRKGVPKRDPSVKIPWYRLSTGVACSLSSAPGITYIFNVIIKINWAMPLIYFMKNTKLPNTYNIVSRQPV